MGLAAGTLMLLTAPGPLVSITNPDTTDLGFAHNHVAVYVAGGALSALQQRQGFWGWTYAAHVELLRNGSYTEIEAESVDQGSPVQFWSLRTGYLLHPKPAAAGGVTIGYRHVGRGRSEGAVEVAFPLIIGSRRGWMRLEPIYVFSSQGVSWNYRFLGEWPMTHRLFGGVDMDFKPIRQDAPYFGTLTFLIGWRH